MFTLKHELETLFIIILASFMTVFFLFQRGNNNLRVASPLPDELRFTAAPTPAAELTPAIQISSGISPDGEIQVVLKTESSENSKKTYSVFVSKTQEDYQKQPPLFSQTVDLSTFYIIPLNTFSIDKKYMFLQKKEKEKTHFLVFNASGKSFTNGDPFIDVTSAFEKYSSAYALYRVTGWASETLLIIQTINKDKSFGPSYWFELPSQSFIQLSTRF